MFFRVVEDGYYVGIRVKRVCLVCGKVIIVNDWLYKESEYVVN